MGQGLGKNSPVQLSLGRENYEALLERHGQWTRWRTATKCACVDSTTFQPNINCSRCGGRGLTYDYQSNVIVQTIVQAKLLGNVLELDEEFKNDELIKIYDRQGNEYNATKSDRYVFLEEASIRGHYYNVVLNRKIAKNKDTAELQKKGIYWEVKGMESTNSKIDGIYYSVPGDIISIGTIRDSLGYEFEIESYRLNLVSLKTKMIEKEGDYEIIEPTEPLIAENVSYIPPFIFGVINQELSKGDAQAVTDSQGDAVCLFPYSYDVSESDVITLFSGTITQKEIITKTNSKTDPLPVFFVSEIVNITNSEGETFTQGKDYILCGTNEIRWLSDCVSLGDVLSVTFRVYPTYTVVRNIPQLRSSENQRFPKKVVVKYMSSYSEKRKIHLNKIQP